MGMITRCSIIIYDDFGNVLIAERGKRNERKWGTFGKEIKGKETEEKCISKAVDKDIKCTIFDLKPFKEYNLEGEEKAEKMINKGYWIDILKGIEEINSKYKNYMFKL